MKPLNALSTFAPAVVGFVLIASALLHLFNPWQFVDSILSYRIAPSWLVGPAAVILPALQLVLGVALLSGERYRRTACLFAALLFTGFLAAQLSAYLRKLDITCGCFGSHSTRIGSASLGFVSVCLVACLLGLQRPRTIAIERAGFTLIELLVVIAILGILAGLTASGVQKVRAAAAKTDCQNRLRQVALALQQHHGQHHAFPHGMSFDLGSPKTPYLGWPVRILPWLEQEPLQKQAFAAFENDPDPTKLYAHAPHKDVYAIPVPVLNCPADPRLPGPQADPFVGKMTFTSYIGVEGQNPFRHDGVLYKDSTIRISEITDGTSQTLIVGERPPSADFRFGWWYRGFGQEGDGSADMLLGVAERNRLYEGCPEGPYDFRSGRLSDICDTFHFWSPHPGGAHFAFADGSVRFLTYGAASSMPALASRAGNDAAAVE